MAGSIYDTPGCTPGSPGAVTPRKAMGAGMMMPKPKDVVRLNQSRTSTGGTNVPGFNRSKGR